MRFAIPTVITLSFFWISVPASLDAEEADLSEANSVAINYLDYLDARFSSWGSDVTPSVGMVEELVDGGRLLGWVFHIEPEGFMVVSRHKELGAVKAWSARGRFDFEAEQGAAVLVRDLMSLNTAAAERAAGRAIDEISPEQWRSITQIDYRNSWLHPPVAATKSGQPSTASAGMDYEEGEELLSTHWRQGDPYNVLFPPVYYWDWSTGQSVQCREHALVGCVATAGAQVMRYWAWPPAAADGTYVDRYWWTHMPDTISTSSPQYQIDAVAGISYNVAIALNMDFECDRSGSFTYDMEGVYERRRYHGGLDVEQRYRFGLPFFTPEQWYELIKMQFNQNRPVQYKVTRHSIVGDGWYEVQVGATTERWYHFNYGWGAADDIWYLLDVIPKGDPEIEYMLTGIRPDLAVGSEVDGFYPTEWLSANHFDRPSRYFDRDVTGSNAEFEAGQGLQYLRPGFWIRNTSSSASDEIVFQGDPAAVSEFYHEAPFGDVKIRISDGAVVIRGGGEMALY